MNLADFIFGLMGEAQQMRTAGVSLEDVQRGLKASLLEYVHAHGLVQDERDRPYSQMHRCLVCRDSGWEPTTRQTREGIVEAYKRCPCQANARTRSSNDAADQVAQGWR